MRFANPEIVMTLWLILPAWWALGCLYRRRQALLRRLAPSPDVLREIVASVNFRALRWSYACIGLLAMMSLVALARPQWGFHLQDIQSRGVDVIVAIDTSRSMLAEDVKPNRLERCKMAVEDLIRRLQGDRIGIIAFAGDAVVACPFTNDYGGVALSLNALSTRSVARGGTDIGAAVDLAIRMYADADVRDKALVLLTDGEQLDGDLAAAARRAKEGGIVVHGIGIGTPDGSLIQIPDGSGAAAFLKDRDGNIVKSRLNEKAIAELAGATGGMYVRVAGADVGLETIYRERLSGQQERDAEGTIRRLYHERFQWPLSLAVIFFIGHLMMPRRLKETRQ